MQHLFDINVAAKYNVNLAIFLKNLAYWVGENRARKTNFHDGRYWSYNTVEAFAEIFPYWTVNQIRTIIKAAIDAKLVIKGNYNKTKYDHTNWYTLTDEGLKLLILPICEKTQIEERKNTNQIAQKHKPIPDNKPASKPANKQSFYNAHEQKQNNEKKHPWAAMKNEKASIEQNKIFKSNLIPIEHGKKSLSEEANKHRLAAMINAGIGHKIKRGSL